MHGLERQRLRPRGDNYTQNLYGQGRSFKRAPRRGHSGYFEMNGKEDSYREIELMSDAPYQITHGGLFEGTNTSLFQLRESNSPWRSGYSG